MCYFYIGLIDHSVTQSGVNLDMTEQPLHMLYQYSFVNSHCSQ